MSNGIRTCLLVEDDPDDQDFFITMLNEISDNTICFTVENGNEAVQFLRNENVRPHYIFTDLNMPEMNGFEFIREMKSMEGFQQIPVIVYSSWYSREDFEKLKSLGALAVYRKSKMCLLRDILTKYFS